MNALHIGPPRSTQQSQNCETIENAAQQAIESTKHAALRGVTCEYQDQTLVLQGSVDSFYQKQLAQETVRRVAGVNQISNRITVRL